MAATPISSSSRDVDRIHTILGGSRPTSHRDEVIEVDVEREKAARDGDSEQQREDEIHIHAEEDEEDDRGKEVAEEVEVADEVAEEVAEEDEDEVDDDLDALILDDDPAEMSSWSGQPSVKGSSEVMRMVLLSFCSIGIAFTWGVEMTYCTPYLLSLGLTKGQTSMVWIAGPLSGLIVQPIIGVMSDGSTLRWGRRRPFIMAGTGIVAVSLVTLGFTKEIAGAFVSDPGTAKLCTIGLAVFALYATDFAINAVMSCSRSLLVDTLPEAKQQAGAAWASRMASIGHISGYGLGAVDLVGLLGTTLGDTQFKQLTLVAATGMLLSSTVTCWAVTERVLLTGRHPNPRRPNGRFKVFRQIWSTLLNTSPRIQAICWAVFWSWIGWFPFLIYSSTWVGETFFRFDVPADAKDSADALGDMGRVGSTALTVYSLVTFLGAWVLPLFVRSPDDDTFTHRPPQSIAHWAKTLNRAKPDLLTVWICSHLMFAGAMFFAPFAASFRFATVLVGFCGLPWTIAMWAPATFMGIEVNKLSDSRRNSDNGDSASQASYRRLSHDSAIEMSERCSTPTVPPPPPGAGSTDTLHLEHGPDAPPPPHPSTGELSGVYFGILNIYTTLPQFISTFISTVVFAVLEPGKSPELATDAHPSEHHGTDGPNAIAVCLFIGAISAVGAAYATRKLRFL